MTDGGLLYALTMGIIGGIIMLILIFTGDYLTYRSLQKRLKKEREATE